jgi:hypothetical protein
VEQRRTTGPVPAMPEGKSSRPPFVAIRSGTERPADAFTRIKYRDYWYWIDDQDFPSKRIFTFLTVLFTLSDTGQKIQEPILTIRAN